jgi:uncharacterized protein YaiE (UPF0345 family)
MKKRNVKSLSLSKKTVSSLATNELTGGTSRTSNLCSVFCTLQCPPPPDTFWCTYTEGSECRCL